MKCFAAAVNSADEFNTFTRFKREFWKITYIIRGRGRALINDHAYPLGEGSVFLVHPDSITTFDMEVREMEVYNILFGLGFIERELTSLKDDYGFFSIFSPEFHQDASNAVYVQKSTPAIRRAILDLAAEYDSPGLNSKEFLRFRLATLLIRMLRETKRAFKSNGVAEMLRYIDHIMETDSRSDTSTTRLAEIFGITPNHLCGIYRKARGMTISQARVASRLETAAKRLFATDSPISDILFECGFNDPSYFYRAFKKHFGKTPEAYRKNAAMTGLD